jgi:hypothetical protein
MRLTVFRVDGGRVGLAVRVVAEREDEDDAGILDALAAGWTQPVDGVEVHRLDISIPCRDEARVTSLLSGIAPIMAELHALARPTETEKK